MKLLVIAPAPDGYQKLAQNEEITSLGNITGIDMVAPLIGRNVTLELVAERIERGYDALLISGHAVGGAMVLGDGSVIDHESLKAYLQRSTIKLVVLSGCNTSARPDAGFLTYGYTDLLPRVGIDLITMQCDVTDVAAIAYSTTLFHELAAGNDLRNAHDVARSAIARHKMVRAPELFRADKGNGEIGGLKRRLDDLTDALAGQRTGDAQDIIRHLVEDLEKMQRRINESARLTEENTNEIRSVRTRVERLEYQVRPPLRIWFLRAVVAGWIVLFVALFSVTPLRDALFVHPGHPFIGVGFELMILILAATFTYLSVAENERQ